MMTRSPSFIPRLRRRRSLRTLCPVTGMRCRSAIGGAIYGSGGGAIGAAIGGGGGAGGGPGYAATTAKADTVSTAWKN